MEASQDDGLIAKAVGDTEDALFGKVVTIAQEMGFSYCAYAIQMPVPISRPTIVMFNNSGPVKSELHQSRGFLATDPTVQSSLRDALPIIWSDSAFDCTPELWAEARDQGLQCGWAQSSRDVNGALGMLTLASGPEAGTPVDKIESRVKMAWLAQFTHVGMAKILLPRYVPETQISMTAREKEVLCWTAEGKTAYEIGHILSVSERTVNFHINNVVTKLRASNKTQAAVKAAALGLLQ